MSVSVPLEQLPEIARSAWTRLRDELVAILGDDLVAMWAHGGTIAVEGPPRSADLDTYVIVRRPLDEQTAQGSKTFIPRSQPTPEWIGTRGTSSTKTPADLRRPDTLIARIGATRRGR